MATSNPADLPNITQVPTYVMEQELKRRSRMVEVLAKRREATMAKVSRLDAEIAMLTGSGYRIVNGAKHSSGGTKLTLVESMHKVMRQGPMTPMSIEAVMEAVQRDGYKTTSRNFRTIVNQTLLQNPKLFKKVSRGQYLAKNVKQ